MSDLTDFLLARITEDEPVARWVQKSTTSTTVSHLTDLQEVAEGTAAAAHFDDAAREGGYTITAARALAECEAKRRIIELHVENESRVAAYRSPRWVDDMNDDDRLNARKAEARCATTEVVVHALAQVYVDHPDYQEEWRP